jgi:hypothetical protein
VLVADVRPSHQLDEPDGEIGYETLCRQHHRERRTAAVANVLREEEQLLPFEE